MNMRNLKYFSFGIISLIFASCIEEKNLSIQNEEELENAELGLSTDFSLKTERSISITATDGEGKTQKGGYLQVNLTRAKELSLSNLFLLDIQMLPVN